MNAPRMPNIIDSGSYRVIREYYTEPFLVVELGDPTGKSAIFVYRNITLEQLENPSHKITLPKPLIRFEPTKWGWESACELWRFLK